MGNQNNSKFNFTTEQISNLLALRKTLHQNPELSNQEFETQKTLQNILEKIGITNCQQVGTSIVAKINGEDSKLPAVAIRGDIDALPIQEAKGHPYMSKKPGVMHACGHDVHASWAIGAAMLLMENKPKRDVLIILQQAEELAEGAQKVLNSKIIPSQLAGIIAAHVDPRYALGEVVHHEGAISSSSSNFNITVHGRSAHAARPKEGLNPIPVAMKLCLSLIETAEQKGDHENILAVTQVNSGVQNNLIPNQATISGTIRCLDPTKKKSLVQSIEAMAESINGCKITITITESSPQVINNQQLSIAAQRSIIEHASLTQVPLSQPNMASEDFGYFSNQYPTWFFRIGITPENKDFIPVHSPDFFAPDDAIFIGALVLSSMARHI